MKTRHAMLLLTALAAAATVSAEIPTYRLDVVATHEVTTSLRGASGAGHLVGDQVVLGVSQPFVATLSGGLQLLPLPAGYVSGLALDVNDAGIVVGTVADSGFPWDLGEPAIWTPDGQGDYAVELLAYPPTVLVAGQPRPTDGGQAVAINDVGQIVGFARLQGFIGGPAMLFSQTDDPVDLGELGFQATVRDLNDHGVIVGGSLRMDLATGAVTDLGLPEPADGIPFTDVIAFAVNDAGEVVAAADLASTVYENYLTYLHNDTEGWIRLNPAQLPSRFVGFYDNNDGGDVSASGGVLFRAEGALVPGYAGLLEASFASWEPALGFLDDARRVATTATAGELNALVLLTPLTAGDANLDDLVDVADLLLVAAAYGESGTVWASGDFDRDGTTGDDDLFLMAASYADDTPLEGLGLTPEFLAAWAEAVAAQGGVTAAPSLPAATLTAHPNPFNPQTVIRFAGLPAGVRGAVRIYNLRGERVRTLHDGAFATTSFTWDGRDQRGGPMPTGVYLVEGRAAGIHRVVKVTLTK